MVDWKLRFVELSGVNVFPGSIVVCCDRLNFLLMSVICNFSWLFSLLLANGFAVQLISRMKFFWTLDRMSFRIGLQGEWLGWDCFDGLKTFIRLQAIVSLWVVRVWVLRPVASIECLRCWKFLFPMPQSSCLHRIGGRSVLCIGFTSQCSHKYALGTPLSGEQVIRVHRKESQLRFLFDVMPVLLSSLQASSVHVTRSDWVNISWRLSLKIRSLTALPNTCTDPDAMAWV